MKTYPLISGITEAIALERNAGHTIGFVPTMGALHEGHISLIKESLKENDVTVCSIFVNPIQFNNKEDLARYPRNIPEDLKMLEAAGCRHVFIPETNEIYPDDTPDISVNFGTLDRVLEGKFRPGHFKGVAIVVNKLLRIVSPDNAYFGKKDYQQLLVIRRLVSTLKIPVNISACPTFREPDGLAMSSRNLRLTIGERDMAPLIYQVLLKVKEKTGKMTIAQLRNWAIKKINENPAFRVEYFEIVDKNELFPLESWKDKRNGIACTAVYLGDVRLIDNIELFS